MAECASPYLFRKDGTLMSLRVVSCASPDLFRKDGTQFGRMMLCVLRLTFAERMAHCWDS